jgi:Flp pilus assembly protein TadG
MPQAVIVIFLLFFAVLAFGWFYWQRAKARDAAAGPAAATSQGTDTSAATPASTDEQ